MQKMIFLFVFMFITFIPMADANQDAAVESFKWDKRYVDEFKKTNLPVYVPSYTPAPEILRNIGPLYVSKFEVNKNRYLFTISRQSVHDVKKRRLSVDVMTMSAGTLPSYRKQPFSTYEIFEKPEGTIHFHGFDVDYFNDRNTFIWKDSGWKYLVWANNPNNAINIMKQVMSINPKGTKPVKGTTGGQFTAFETIEGIRSDAGWTYDNGKIWYIITSRSTPEQKVKVLKTMVKLETK